jgi:methionyl aminopeptidase
MQEYIDAGRIASNARDMGISLVKEDMLISELVSRIEERIQSLGGQMAFPINVSLNDCAAHDTANIKDERSLKKGDVVKIDVGVHIDGYIADTAKTIEIGSEKHKDLVIAAEKALDAAIKLSKPGTKLWELGEAIEKEMASRGFNPIRNLSGHGLERYNLHSGTNVPNYNNNDRTELEEGEVIAIEPFATTGVGVVIGRGNPKIFMFEKISRISRSVSLGIKKKFSTLPFAKTWLDRTELFYLNNMVKEGSLRDYEPLFEKTGGIVSQAEHTVVVADEPIVTTL